MWLALRLTNTGKLLFFCRVLWWMFNRMCCYTPDIDECALPATCPLGTCTNTEGSFTCMICQPGFRVSEDGQQCDSEGFGCVRVGMFFVLFLCSITADHVWLPNKAVVKAEWATSQLVQVVCKQHQVWQLGQKEHFYLNSKSQNSPSRHHIIAGSQTPASLAPLI